MGFKEPRGARGKIHEREWENSLIAVEKGELLKNPLCRRKKRDEEHGEKTTDLSGKKEAILSKIVKRVKVLRLKWK